MALKRRPLLQRLLDGQPLDARTELNAVAVGVIDHELGVFRLAHRRAVRQQNHVGLDLAGDGEVLLAALGRFLDRAAAAVTGRAAAGDARRGK